MTLDEKCNISRLQQQGMGYRKIASELGISENTVKSYLRRHSKIKSSEEISGGCKRCGKAIEQKPHKRKKEFCSDYCRSRWWRKNTDLSESKTSITKQCNMCNNEFACYRSENRSFCSRKCYVESLNKERSYRS